MGNEDRAKAVFNAINNMMSTQYAPDGQLVRWFFCFGTLKEYLCERTFTLDYDVDIGVLYDECDSRQMVDAMHGSFGYEVRSVVLHDVTKKPLNVHLKPVGHLAGTPDIDIFFWLRKNDKLYHTYDMNKSGESILPKYTFKGIKREWVCPPQEDVDRKRKPTAFCPDSARIIDSRGVWHLPIFGDCSGYEFYAPYAYGSLLDEWYLNWRFRTFDKGQSRSRWVQTVKSCKDLK